MQCIQENLDYPQKKQGGLILNFNLNQLNQWFKK